MGDLIDNLTQRADRADALIHALRVRQAAGGVPLSPALRVELDYIDNELDALRGGLMQLERELHTLTMQMAKLVRDGVRKGTVNEAVVLDNNSRPTKLDAAVAYLKANPRAMNMSTRQLARVQLPVVGVVSNAYWHKAKKQVM